MNRKRHSISVDLQVVQSLLDAIPNPVLLISEHDEVLKINDSAEKAWNIKKDQLLGHKLSYTCSSLEENALCPAIIHIEGKKYEGLIVKTEHSPSSDSQN